MKREKKIALTIVWVTCLTVAAFGIGMLISKFASWKVQTKKYLSYEYAQNGPKLSFSSKLEKPLFSKGNYNSFYKDDNGVRHYYFHLSDYSSKKMVVVEDYGGWGDHEQFLLYNPEQVNDPYRALIPTEVQIQLNETKEGIPGSSLKVLYDDRELLCEFWNQLLDITPQEQLQGSIVLRQSDDSYIRCDLTMYFDSRNLIYVEAVLFEDIAGNWFWRVLSDERGIYYYLPCTGTFLKTVTAFMDNLKPEEVPVDTTQPPMTTILPASDQTPES